MLKNKNTLENKLISMRQNEILKKGKHFRKKNEMSKNYKHF